MEVFWAKIMFRDVIKHFRKVSGKMIANMAIKELQQGHGC